MQVLGFSYQFTCRSDCARIKVGYRSVEESKSFYFIHGLFSSFANENSISALFHHSQFQHIPFYLRADLYLNNFVFATNFFISFWSFLSRHSGAKESLFRCIFRALLSTIYFHHDAVQVRWKSEIWFVILIGRWFGTVVKEIHSISCGSEKENTFNRLSVYKLQYICRLVASYMLRQSNYDVPCPHFDIIFTVFNIDLCLYSGRTSKQRHKKISCEKIFLKWKAVSRRRAEEKKSTEETFCVHILAVIVITQYYIWNKAMREVTFCGGVISVLSLVVATAFSSWAQVFFHNFVHNHQDPFRYNVFFSNHQDSNSMSTVKMISKLLLVCNGYGHLK